MRWEFGAALVLAAIAAPAAAGPPYLTDDPVPTDTGHWEIYVFTAGEGRGSSLDGDAGVDLNFGPAKDVQLTATLPLSYTHDPQDGWRTGTGDVELGVKYRFYKDEAAGVSAAIFPRVILPTSSLPGAERTRILLPVWVQKDIGKTSVFGGGGFEVNPGPGNRDFWQASVAVTHELSDTISAGAELAHQTADTVDGTSQTRASVGTIVRLSEPYALLLSAGPTWADRRTGYHFYAGLGLTF